MISKSILMLLVVLSACVQAQESGLGESSILEYADGGNNGYPIATL